MKSKEIRFINNLREFIVLCLALCVFLPMMAIGISNLCKNIIGGLTMLFVFGFFGLSCIICMFVFCEIITISDNCVTYSRALKQSVIFYKNVTEDIVVDDYSYRYGMTGIEKMWKITDVDDVSIFIVYSKRRERYIRYIQNCINIR